MTPTLIPDTRRGGTLSWVGPTCVLFLAMVYFLLPLLWLVISATKSGTDLLSSFGFWFADDNHFADNLRTTLAYNDGALPRWMLNSVLYSTVGATVATVVSAMGGYALAKYDFPGRTVVFASVMAGVLVPPAALALPLFLMMSSVQLTDSMWAVLLPSMISPFGIYLGRVYAEASVPDELLEAARIDGAGDIRFFFTIALPMMAPALVTIFLFQFVAVWNNFMLPLLVLVNDRLYPVTMGLWTMLSLTKRYPELRPVILTGVLLSIIPLIIAFVLLQRFWRSGLASGAMKG